MTRPIKLLTIVGLLLALAVFPMGAALAEDEGIPDIIWDWAANLGIDDLVQTGAGTYTGVIVNATLAQEGGLLNAVDGMSIQIIDEEMEAHDVVVRIGDKEYGINRWQ